MQSEKINKCRFQDAEVLGAYLYTGPCFMPYNGIYRKFPPSIVKLLQGDDNFPQNTLSTTLFCISSALKKLASHTEIPKSGIVYRGLGSMLLPSSFWVDHGEPSWRGGVERAIMSTTTDKDIALFYSGGKGTLVEIQVGRIQMGGDMGWISMASAISSSRIC